MKFSYLLAPLKKMEKLTFSVGRTLECNHGCVGLVKGCDILQLVIEENNLTLLNYITITAHTSPLINVK